MGQVPLISCTQLRRQRVLLLLWYLSAFCLSPLAVRKGRKMAKNGKEFTTNYDGSPIPTGWTMVPFPYDKLDAENCTNCECIGVVPMGGHYFPVIYKAVPDEWEKEARSSLNLVENEALGHYNRKDTISTDSLWDEYGLELGEAPSAEDAVMEKEDLTEAINTFADLIRTLIDKSPKHGYAVLLLHAGVKGNAFYSRMRLSRSAANNVRKKAEEITKIGLAVFDISGLKCYKQKNDDFYRQEALALLDQIVDKIRNEIL